MGVGSGIIIGILITSPAISQDGWFSVSAGYEYTHIGCYFLNTQTGWVVKETNGVLKTVNGGTQWVDQYFSNWEKPMDIQFVNADVGWMSALDKRLYKTQNGGELWELILEDTSDDLQLSADTGYCVGGWGTILKTENGGVGTNALFEEPVTLPGAFILYQNYPNPFNPNTTIRYDLTLNSDVNLSIFDIKGRRIKTLVSKRQPAGQYSVEWHPTQLAGGIYYCCLRANSGAEIIKMILVR